MTRYDKLKQEISAMSLDDFMKHFVVGGNAKDYVCSEIKVPYAHCVDHHTHNCGICIREYLESEDAK